jgi:glucose/arabinose dehydrogenase
MQHPPASRARRCLAPVALALLLIAAAPGCFPFQASQGGGQTSFEPPRRVERADVAVVDGFVVTVIAQGLTFPTGVAIADDGTLFVTEGGYAYGEVFTIPRLLRLDADGGTSVVATGENPPWNGVAWAEGSLFVAEGGVLEGGRILRIEPDGEVRVLAEGLPSLGDHHTNGPLIEDGWVYFGQGVVTNSGVVGLDNHGFGWLERAPEVHDIPCEDVVLTGAAFETPDPLGRAEVVRTSAFQPFGVSAEEGEVAGGSVPCSGAVLRVPVAGGPIELVAWGFRNPFGLAQGPDGAIWVSDNMYDVRGSRPVFGAGDLLWRLIPGRWYGWPDFHGQQPLFTGDRYRPPGERTPERLLVDHPDTPPQPAAVLAVHSSSNGFDLARSERFGFVGDAFVAQFGDMAPGVGKVLAPAGFRVVRVDVERGVIEDFLVNRAGAGPASLVGGGGLERPVAARFDPDGEALYVVDFGVMLVTDAGPVPVPGTGVLWRVTREGAP